MAGFWWLSLWVSDQHSEDLDFNFLSSQSWVVEICEKLVYKQKVDKTNVGREESCMEGVTSYTYHYSVIWKSVEAVLSEWFQVNVGFLHVLSLLVPLWGDNKPFTLGGHYMVVTVTNQLLRTLGIEHNKMLLSECFIWLTHTCDQPPKTKYSKYSLQLCQGTKAGWGLGTRL